MELFKYLLFGIAGLSTIFWVAVIALWHTYMFPRFFKEDQYSLNTKIQNEAFKLKPSGLVDRAKYSNKSFVIADFTPVEDDYGVNRLYTSMLISLGVMSFLLISYGLHSGLTQFT
ncbi:MULTISPECIES: hypothetical protein [unclassified Prochlorococcus]|uniref:hypothetical protein n=1 Tax=unclassified Prochlorococcus TaxID=2627481 RepID=UPI000533A5B7|nr:MULTISPECIES: hypothetical protein [unclassified Prochlorococcus]KGG15493.1 hypothetical protein EV06_1366 [Prochlorococcus sp. MIT 0602]KGG17774.1 hypothetical protein EV07_1214 [Prochlorococcus sp. MIT 0603]